MRSKTSSIGLIIFLFTCSACTHAGQVPSSGNLVKQKKVEIETSNFEVSKKGKTKIFFPIRPDQDNLAEEPDYQVYASYAYTKNGKWQMAKQNNFAMETSKEKNGKLKVIIDLHDFHRDRWTWIRVWAKDLKSENYLWIDQGSKFCRKDKEGRVGYELILNPNTGDIQPVPTHYDTRE